MRRALALCFALSTTACLTPQPRGGGKPRVAKVKKRPGAVAKSQYDGKDRAITAHNLVANATFNDGTSLPWTSSFTAPAAGAAKIVDGALCLEVANRGQNNWDAQIRHREMVIEGGHSYAVTFRAWANQPTKARPKVGMQGPPYEEYWVDTVKLDKTPRSFSGAFRKAGADDPTAELTFHVGGNLAYGVDEPLIVCVDDVVLEDPRFVRKDVEKDDARPVVLVNQLGYFPGLAKMGVVRSESTAPLAWSLVDAQDQPVASGKTIVHGADAPSGDSVHVVDFSSFTKEGRGYRLVVGADRSHPFDIRADLYRRLKIDALKYFYHNRSGIEIALPFAGEKRWTRPAGHAADKSVPCRPGSGCGYTLDVAGGWYDAGDHGKYVVNGGISVWTLMNFYERTAILGTSEDDFGDGKLGIPEKDNGVPDLLDEARWEMEWMLKMQVPAGQPLAGMAHHKVHDKEWTALGLAPHDDPMPRFLHPPSTAAALNLAATAAQAARLWKKIDPGFAARCLAAAEVAYHAAVKNPARFAPAGGVGGGPYDDRHVDDEFYWAAAELFVTTKKDEYRDAIKKSPYFLKMPSRIGTGAETGLPSSMTWQNTEALGTISLALVPNALSASETSAARVAVTAAADAYLAVLATRGYRVPMDYGAANKAPWGSVSFVVNNVVVLALANDLTGERKYLDGAVAGLDYVLGRNALDQSYVTGYGDRPLENPHHRFWAFQSNAKFPKAPPGCVSGGPGSGLEDPYVKAAGLAGCAPETCFVDNIESWSTNEITINWNAPFAWAVAFLDEKGASPPARSKPNSKPRKPARPVRSAHL